MNTELGEANFHILANIFYELTGIKYGIEKYYLLENRLLHFINGKYPFRSYRELIEALRDDSNTKLRGEFVNTLTTNYSYFFREPVHFRFLSYICANKFSDEKELRFWSAAASAGQEAYSMAIAAYRIAHLKKIKILGTDIAADKIEDAKTAVYAASQIDGRIAPESINHFFRILDESSYEVKKILKERVRFNLLNLKGSYPFKKNFHVIFLRNVLIYFKPEEKIEILTKISQVLHPQGYLILSLSESISGLKVPFKHINHSIYQLR